MKKFIFGISFLCTTLIAPIKAEVIIDVRTVDEYKSGHIENSLNIEWQAIEEINESIAREWERGCSVRVREAFVVRVSPHTVSIGI